MGYGMSAASDGRWFPWVFNFPTNYWSQASAVIRYIGQQEGGLEKLKGKKIVHIFHNSAYGKEANPTLEELSKKYQFELTLLAVDHPGQEQKATWLQVRRLNPDWIFMSGWGVMNQVAIKEAVSVGFKMDHFIGNWWSANDSGRRAGRRGRQGLQGRHVPRAGHGLQGARRPRSKFVYDKGKGSAKKEEIGAPLYNRGLVNAMLSAEAIRTAMAKFGQQAAHRRAGALGLREPQPHRAAARAGRHAGLHAPAQGDLRGPRGQRPCPHPAVGRQEVVRRHRLDRADARGRCGRRSRRRRSTRPRSSATRCATARRRSRARR